MTVIYGPAAIKAFGGGVTEATHCLARKPLSHGRKGGGHRCAKGELSSILTGSIVLSFSFLRDLNQSRTKKPNQNKNILKVQKT